MNEEHEFHRQLAANPDDTTTRGVYADWLEEQGYPGLATAIRPNMSTPFPLTSNSGRYTTQGPPSENEQWSPKYTEGTRSGTISISIPTSHDPKGYLTFHTVHSLDKVGSVLRSIRDRGVDIRVTNRQDQEALDRHLNHVEETPPERMSRRFDVRRRYGRLPADELPGWFQQGEAGGTFDPQNTADNIFADKLADADDPRELHVRRDLSYRQSGRFANAVDDERERLHGAEHPEEGLTVTHDLNDGTRLMVSNFGSDENPTSYSHEWYGPGHHSYLAVLSPAEHADVMRRLGIGVEEPDPPEEEYDPPGTPTGGPNSPGGMYYARRGSVRRYGLLPAHEIKAFAQQGQEGGQYDPNNTADLVFADRLEDADDVRHMIVRRDIEHRGNSNDEFMFNHREAHHKLGGSAATGLGRSHPNYGVINLADGTTVNANPHGTIGRYDNIEDVVPSSYEITWDTPYNVYYGAFSPEEHDRIMGGLRAEGGDTSYPGRMSRRVRPTTPSPRKEVLADPDAVVKYGKRCAAVVAGLKSSLEKTRYSRRVQARPKRYAEGSGYTDADFHAKIVGEPDETTPALVYADWLDEQGRADHADIVRRHVAHWGRGALTGSIPGDVPSGTPVADREENGHDRLRVKIGNRLLAWSAPPPSEEPTVTSPDEIDHNAPVKPDRMSRRTSILRYTERTGSERAKRAHELRTAGKQFDEIGAELGVSKQRAAQLVAGYRYHLENPVPRPEPKPVPPPLRPVGRPEKGLPPGYETEADFRDHVLGLFRTGVPVKEIVRHTGGGHRQIAEIVSALEPRKRGVKVNVDRKIPEEVNGYPVPSDSSHLSRLSQRRYAAYRAPAGGMVVRGTAYKGGAMIPDMEGEFANPPQPVRKEEGSPTPIPGEAPYQVNSGTNAGKVRRIDVMRRIAARRKKVPRG